MKIKIISKNEYPELKKLRDNFEVSDKADVCVAVGGDGTFIRAANAFSGPILPIRSGEPGSTGYYADVSLLDIDKIIDRLKTKKYAVEALGKKLEVSFKGEKRFAVNEILLHNVVEEVYFRIFYSEGGKMNQIYPYVIAGDGLIISANVGSTAYNRAANGPIIIDPDNICITLLVPDGSFKNSIILPHYMRLHVKVEKGSGILRYDGTDLSKLEKGDEFSVFHSDVPINVIKFSDMREEFSSKLKRLVGNKLVNDIV